MPIEIGWAFADPETGSIQVESHLIHPLWQWHIADAWKEAAEGLHGLSLNQIYAEGPAPTDILRRMNEVLDGRELCSDARARGGDSLHMIVEAAGAKPSYSVSHAEAHTVIGAVAREKAWKTKDCLAAMEKVAIDYPRTHRAAADAHHLAVLWLAMRQGPSSRS